MERRLIESCAACVPGWRPIPRHSFSVQQLHGGLTNRMYIVTCHEPVQPSRAVVRVHPQHRPVSVPWAPCAASLPSCSAHLARFPRREDLADADALLAAPQSVFIDRAVEADVLEAVSNAGIGPRVWGHGSMPLSCLLDPESEREAAVALGESPGAALILQLRVEEWVPGPTLLAAQLPDKAIHTDMAAILRRLHAVSPAALTATHAPPAMDRVMLLCLWLCELAVEDAPSDLGEMSSPGTVTHAGAVEDIRAFMSEYDLRGEVDWMVAAARSSASPLVLTHNDAQPGNWMAPGHSPRGGEGEGVAPAASRLALIDYEYAGINYRGFEAGNLFCEFAFDYHHKDAPYFSFDLAKYPGEAVKRSFFEAYVAATGPASEGTLPLHVPVCVCECVAVLGRAECDANCPFPSASFLLHALARVPRSLFVTVCVCACVCAPAGEVCALVAEADLFMLASHLHWALWSLPMSLSDMAGKFGYIEYGRARMDEYLRLKRERGTLEVPTSPIVTPDECDGVQ